jgi:hypothetical protein
MEEEVDFHFNHERSKFKDKMGRLLTNSLFYERRQSSATPMYTIYATDRVVDGVTYPSLKRLFLEERDIIGYEFANKYLYGWEHWERLQKNKDIRKLITQWKVELDLLIKSETVKAMIESANAGSVPAQKELLKRGYLEEPEKEKAKEDKKVVEEEADLLASFLEDVKTEASAIN